MTRCRVGCLVLLLVMAGGPRPASAHDVAPEPFVNVLAQPAGAELHLTVTLPLAALAEANLPRSPDGSVASPDDRALDLIGRNIAGELEVEQDEVPLAAPTVRTAIAAGGDAVEVALTYSIQPDAGHISARLRTFRGYAQTVRTMARYEPGQGVARSFLISGDPERVSFDPWPGEVVQHFVGRGTETLLATIDFLLLMLCVVAPLRRSTDFARVVAAAVAGEAVTVVLQASHLIALGPGLTAGASAVGASVVAVAALVALVRPASRWFGPLAFAFGALHGVGVGADFLADASFAGTHAAIGVLVFLLVVSLGQVWIATLVASAAGLAFRRGLPERLAGIALAVLAGHSAIHLVADRGQLFSPGDILTADRAMALLALAWVLIILLAGTLGTFFRQRDHGQSEAPAANGASAG